MPFTFNLPHLCAFHKSGFALAYVVVFFCVQWFEVIGFVDIDGSYWPLLFKLSFQILMAVSKVIKCCFMTCDKFSAVLCLVQDQFRDDNDVRFELHGLLDFVSDRSLKPNLWVDMSLHLDTLFWFQANSSLLFLFLNAACLAEKQQIPIS